MDGSCQEQPLPGRQSYMIPIARIAPLPAWRTPEEDLKNLAASIRQNGLMQPVYVARQQEGYRLITGARRLQACRMLGFSCIEAFVLPETEDGCFWTLVENGGTGGKRADMRRALLRGALQAGMDGDALARRLRVDRTDIARAADGGKENRSVPATAENGGRTGRVLALALDPRLYINGLKRLLKPLRNRGQVPVLTIREGAEEMEVRIVIRRPGGEEETHRPA